MDHGLLSRNGSNTSKVDWCFMEQKIFKKCLYYNWTPYLITSGTQARIKTARAPQSPVPGLQPATTCGRLLMPSSSDVGPAPFRLDAWVLLVLWPQAYADNAHWLIPVWLMQLSKYSHCVQRKKWLNDFSCASTGNCELWPSPLQQT